MDSGASADAPDVATLVEGQAAGSADSAENWKAGDSGEESEDEEEGKKPDVNYRKIFDVVAELHRRGYQRLRIFPMLSPSGCYWRCNLLPLDNVCTMTHSYPLEYEDALLYSSGEGPRFLDGLADLNVDSAESIADKMIQSFSADPESVVARAKGDDTPYAEWFTGEFLAKLPPDVLPCLISPDDDPDQDEYHVPLLSEEHKDVKIKFPPVRIDAEEVKPIAALMSLAKARDWKKVLKMLEGDGVCVDMVNPCTKSGFALLHHAAWWGDYEPARKLIELGADIKQPDSRDRTPLQVAKSRKHKKERLLKLLSGEDD